jgi:hypothetical protein
VIALALLVPLAAASPAEILRVRTTEAAAPCVAAALRSYPRAGGSVAVEIGPLRGPEPADVLVGFGPEMTRAIESGLASDPSVEVASIPWTLIVRDTAGRSFRSLAELRGSGVELVVLGGPTAYEARRALGAHPPDRVRETTDPQELRTARVALVPLSLAGTTGTRVAVDVPPLIAEATTTVAAHRPDAARAFVAFLATDEGRRAFAACAP